MSAGAIYQGTLSVFPEVKRPYKYFDQDPIVNGGYEAPTEFLTKRGIFKTEGKRVQTNNGNWVTSSSWKLWSTEVLLPGKFILLDSGNGAPVVYRIMQDADWHRQGGFYVYNLEERIGNSTLKQFRPIAESGANEFT